MKNKKHKITIYDKITHQAICIIYRVLKSENIGNFNPIFCRYQDKECLVLSKEGDLSDPYRREESYLENLYILI